ncbi:MAG: flavin reductase family protein [Candidatus Bathyarchaeota archaeon]|nr:flavin reductase family protein [Candidatus Bathyarchaeota archaeon]
MAEEFLDVPLGQSIRVGPPISVVLATSVSPDGKPNIITLGMYMPISIRPPLITIGVAPKRYSHDLIAESGEFVVNVPTKEIVEQTALCGAISGRTHDKFRETGLTPIPASIVKPPLIKECASSLECKVKASYTCGDHTIFVGEVVAAHVKKGMLKMTLDVSKAQTLSHKGPRYFVPKQVYEVKS